MPLHRRLPKRGFNNKAFGTVYAPVNVSALNVFQDGDTVDEAALREKRLVTGNWSGIKILGNGELERKLTVNAHAASKAAADKITKAGGSLALHSASPQKETATA